MINLTKSSPKISLEKSASGSGEMRVNLNWSQPPRKTGFWSSFTNPENIDLDLGCLFELQNGEKGVVQALGNSFGSYDWEPYIQLDADDRSGENVGGENIFVNMGEVKNIKRLLFFAFIYEGAPSWNVANGVVTLFPPTGDEITIRLDAHEDMSMCAIASVEILNGQVSVKREIKYFSGHEAMDRSYQWGLRWVEGTKD